MKQKKILKKVVKQANEDQFKTMFQARVKKLEQTIIGWPVIEHSYGDDGYAIELINKESVLMLINQLL